MESFKKWLEDIGGKSLNSVGLDINPVKSVTSAGQAVKAFTSDPAHANDISRMRANSGAVAMRKGIDQMVPLVQRYSAIPIPNQSFNGMDIARKFAMDYFPRQNLYKSTMRRMMLKKMGKK